MELGVAEMFAARSTASWSATEDFAGTGPHKSFRLVAVAGRCRRGAGAARNAHSSLAHAPNFSHPDSVAAQAVLSAVATVVQASRSVT